MTKGWLVSDGQYSDYCVLAAFTDRAKAEAYVARLSRPGQMDYPIEEIDLDPPPVGGRGYWGYRIAEDGELLQLWHGNDRDLPLPPPKFDNYSYMRAWTAYGWTQESAEANAQAFLLSRQDWPARPPQYSVSYSYVPAHLQVPVMPEKEAMDAAAKEFLKDLAQA